MGKIAIRTGVIVMALLILSSNVASGPSTAPLPEWPWRFGPPRDVVDGLGAPPFVAVPGPGETVYCFIATGDRGRSICVKALDRLGNPMGDASPVAQIEGTLIDFDATPTKRGAVLFYASRVGDSYFLCSVELDFSEQGEFTRDIPTIVRRVDSVVTDVSVTVSGGKPVYGWIDQEEGRPAVVVSQAGDADLPQDRTRLSSYDVSAGELDLFTLKDGYAAAWIESADISYSLVLSVVREGAISKPLTIAPASANQKRGLALLEASDGSMHIAYTTGAVIRGDSRSAALAYAKLDMDGSLVEGPIQVSGGEGFALSPAMCSVEDGITLVWADDRQGKLDIYWSDIALQTSGCKVSETGAVTYSQKECLNPLVFVFNDGSRLVLYQTYLKEGTVRIRSSSTADAQEPDWRYYLGLDMDNPWGDAAFLLVNGAFAALVASLMALPAVATGAASAIVLDRLDLFSRSGTGWMLRMLTAFSVSFAFKGAGWMSLASPELALPLSMVSFAVSAVFALVVQSLFEIDRMSALSTAAGTWAFTYADALFSIIQKGVRYF